jgi:hypothetical protein
MTTIIPKYGTLKNRIVQYQASDLHLLQVSSSNFKTPSGFCVEAGSEMIGCVSFQ